MPNPISSYSLAPLPSTDERGALRFALQQNGTPLTYDAVITSWCEDAEFRAAYNELLATVQDFDGFYWEPPPLTQERLAEPYEFVLVPGQTLSRLQPDPTAFAEHFSDAAPVVHFSNLGGDAELIVPCPRGKASVYPPSLRSSATARPTSGTPSGSGSASAAGRSSTTNRAGSARPG